MATNASSLTPYATAADMLARYSVGLLGQLCDDTGIQTSAASLLDDSTTAGANLAEALQDASGEIEGRCIRGGKYTSAILNALVGMAQKRLIRLTTRVTMALLLERRDPVKELPKWHEKVEDALERLEKGEEIFGIQEAMDAGKGMDTVRLPDALPGPRPAISQVAGRYFGDRARTYTPDEFRLRRVQW